MVENVSLILHCGEKLTLADSLRTPIAGWLPCLPEAFFAEWMRCDSAEATSFAALINITCIHSAVFATMLKNIHTSWLNGVELVHIIFNTIPPCPEKAGEGTAVKDEEWRESTFHKG